MSFCSYINALALSNVRFAGDPPAISNHVEGERVSLTPSEHEALSSAYADSSTE